MPRISNSATAFEPAIAVFDACILYPFHLRNIIVQAAVDRLIDARWTDEIHEEWIHNLATTNPNIPILQDTCVEPWIDFSVVANQLGSTESITVRAGHADTWDQSGSSGIWHVGCSRSRLLRKTRVTLIAKGRSGPISRRRRRYPGGSL